MSASLGILLAPNANYNSQYDSSMVKIHSKEEEEEAFVQHGHNLLNECKVRSGYNTQAAHLNLLIPHIHVLEFILGT